MIPLTIESRSGGRSRSWTWVHAHFAEIVEKLAQARINIKNAYVAGEGGNQLVVLSVANADKAEQVLGG